MNQEQSFKKFYQGLTPSEITDEINTLANEYSRYLMETEGEGKWQD